MDVRDAGVGSSSLGAASTSLTPRAMRQNALARGAALPPPPHYRCARRYSALAAHCVVARLPFITAVGWPWPTGIVVSSLRCSSSCIDGHHASGSPSVSPPLTGPLILLFLLLRIVGRILFCALASVSLGTPSHSTTRSDTVSIVWLPLHHTWRMSVDLQ